MDITDLMALLSTDTTGAVSRKSGASADEVSSVLASALPLLLQSMQQNASTEEGAASLAEALDTHAEDEAEDVETFIDGVDTTDGAKILAHIFGVENETKQTDIAETAGVDMSKAGEILATAAPLLLTLLGTKKKKSKSGADGLADMLGALLSTNTSGKKSKSSAGIGAEGLGTLLSLAGGLFSTDISDEEETPKKTTAKKTTAKKATTAKKTATAKKTTTAAKKTTAAAKKTTTAAKKTTTAAKKTTGKTVKAATKKKAAVSAEDASELLGALAELLKK